MYWLRARVCVCMFFCATLFPYQLNVRARARAHAYLVRRLTQHVLRRLDRGNPDTHPHWVPMRVGLLLLNRVDQHPLLVVAGLLACRTVQRKLANAPGVCVCVFACRVCCVCVCMCGLVQECVCSK